MTAAEVSRRLIAHLQFDLRVFRAQRTAEDAFKYLRTQVERTGVFVLLIGNLGSHHSNVSVEVFRGFALADDVAPFIVVNDQDAKVAWSFTVLHELVHIWLGKPALVAAR
jgi:Zn-dependent peptidase ImmA (M78 family)